MAHHDAAIEARAQELLGQMTLAEKVAQMCSDVPLLRGLWEAFRAYNFRPIPGGGNHRLGVPPVAFSDGPRGVVMNHSTCFPVGMARGATFDPELEARVADAIGVEVRSLGGNFFAGICINVLRHPAWGRAQETYGEDPFHLGEMGVAAVHGVQRHAMACVKHFALNSIENVRFRVDVRLDERTLHEVYLPHFRRCVDAGAAAVMSAYNKVNGERCGHHRRLLREILKGDWGFQGFVISDFVFGIRSARRAALGGLDLEMPVRMHYHWRLRRLVRRGIVSASVVDEAVRRLLRQKLRFAPVGEPERYGPHAIACAAHRALAREVAQQSIVLLQNTLVRDGAAVLPIDLPRTHSIAVIGRLASLRNTGDRGSSRVRAPYVVTPLDGIRHAAGRCTITYEDGSNPQAAAEAARRADVAIVIAGYTHRDEGEYVIAWGGDRAQLTLRPADEALIRRVAAANPRTATVMIGGSAIITEAWRETVPAILMAWYPGMEGGHALADVLFGRVNPSGKLPCVFPRSAAHLPWFDRTARQIEYGYFHGYRLLDKNGHEPAFPFGFGLSYSRFRCDNLQVVPDRVPLDGAVEISVDLTNLGPRSGAEVVQLYVGYDGSVVERPLKELRGFRKVHLEPGQTQRIAFRLRPNDLAYFDAAAHRWSVEAIRHPVYVGTSSHRRDLIAGEFGVTA
jgi:beta-glucosidase